MRKYALSTLAPAEESASTLISAGIFEGGAIPGNNFPGPALPPAGAPYISRRFSMLFDIVTSSANSISLPTGIPMAMRDTFIPSGLSNRAM